MRIFGTEFSSEGKEFPPPHLYGTAQFQLSILLEWYTMVDTSLFGAVFVKFAMLTGIFFV